MSVFAIALLILNDHILKATHPSWWTGKLSDFAGLFFFPFVIAAALGILMPSHARKRTGAAIAMWVGLWFAATKTTAVGNEATVQLARALMGTHIAIVRDPTDLIALGVLCFAAVLWNREVETPSPLRLAPPRSRFAGWPSLLIACLGTIATSIAPDDAVVRLVEKGDDVYAISIPVSRGSGSYAEAIDPESAEIHVSQDGGISWELTEARFDELRLQPRAPGELPLVISSGSDQFRILANGRIESREREREGEAWRTEWEVPRSRLAYHERVGGGPVGFFDAIALKDGPGALLVAAGKHGVLRRSAGDWSAHGVGRATPVVLYETEPLRILQVIIVEIAWLLIAACLSSTGLALRAWVILGRGGESSPRRTWVILACCLGLVPAATVLLLVAQAPLTDDAWVAYLVITPLALVGAFTYAWTRFIRSAGRRDCARRAFAAWWRTSLLLAIAPVLVLALWPSGILPWYGLALSVASVTWLGILARGAARISNHARLAASG